MCEIDWNKSAAEIYNFVRGLAPVPGSFTFFRNNKLKILGSQKSSWDGKKTAKPGEVLIAGKNAPVQVQTGSGVVTLVRVQPEGKRPMSIDEFIRGYRIQAGEILKQV
jgi:methionyl-tRNA formyltransferase